MRYALAFSVLGIILAVLAIDQAWRAEGVGWLLLAVEADGALVMLALAIAFGLRSAGVDVEGRTCQTGWRMTIAALLLPYRALGRAALGASGWLDREGPINRLAPGIFIGRLPSRTTRVRLGREGIDAILNLCWEFPGPSTSARGPVCGHVPILDGAPPTDRQFDEAVRWVADRRAEGRCILIHCAQGHGRTATIAAAVMVRFDLADDADDALARIQAVRPGARPSRTQRSALDRYLGRSSADRSTDS